MFSFPTRTFWLFTMWRMNTGEKQLIFPAHHLKNLAVYIPCISVPCLIASDEDHLHPNQQHRGGPAQLQLPRGGQLGRPGGVPDCHAPKVSRYLFVGKVVVRMKLLLHIPESLINLQNKSHCSLERRPLWVIWVMSVLFNNSKPILNHFPII